MRRFNSFTTNILNLKPTEKRLTALLALVTLLIGVMDYFIIEDNSIAFLKMLIIFATLYLPGYNCSHLFAAATACISIFIGYLKLGRFDIQHLASERFFVLLSIALTLLLVLWLKKSRAQLVAQKQLLENVFEQIGEGIVLVAMDGKIERANSAMCRMFGYDLKEIVGQPIEILIPQRFGHAHVGLRDSYGAKPRARQMGEGQELFAKRKGGAEFPVAISLSPITDDGKRFVIAVVVDVTQQKAHEASLQLQKKDLTDLALRLRTSNEDLENFAYIASHDLQEPLRKIQFFSEAIVNSEKERLSPEGIETFGRVQKAASRMQALINDLLAFSRLHSQPPVLQKTRLETVIKDSIADLDMAAKESGAEIRIGKLPETIAADPFQLRQLFQNLISNALKFKREEVKPVIEVFAENSKDGQFVEVHVRDNGIGFDEKYLDRMFTIFQRLDGNKYPGTGIGLAICKKIALYHRGSITAKSKPGEGSDFIVTLPLMPAN